MAESGERIPRPILESLPKDSEKPFNVPTLLMDELTYQLVQMPDLLRAMDTSVTYTGSLVLNRSFRQPPNSLELIRAKQEAVDEVNSNPKLGERIEDFLYQASKEEEAFYAYFRGDYGVTPFDHKPKPNIYDAFKGTRKLLQTLTQNAANIEADSPYLANIVTGLQGFSNTNAYDWVENPIYATPRGLRNKSNLRWYSPRWRFFATDYNAGYYIGLPVGVGILAGGMLAGLDVLISILAAGPYSTEKLMEDIAFSSRIAAVMPFTMAALMPIGIVRVCDDIIFVKKAAKHYFEDRDVIEAIDNLGKMDELLALAKYGKKVGGNLPLVTDDPQHHFSARGLRNPLMATQNPNYVPNDIVLDGVRLTFLTGPNSGGKTSLCKSIAQAQVLAQIGSPIPADSAEIAIADRVFYLAPMINSLEDTEGRFGIEVARIRDIFFQSTPKSLVIPDELIEATTNEEKLEKSKDILEGFWHVGNNTFMVTHNHELADYFRNLGMGQFLQVEFDGRRPTYKVIRGISRESHADEVMERLGFTRDDIFRHLRKAGYIE